MTLTYSQHILVHTYLHTHTLSLSFSFSFSPSLSLSHSHALTHTCTYTHRQIQDKQSEEQVIKDESLQGQQQLDDLRQDHSQWEGQARDADRKIRDADTELKYVTLDSCTSFMFYHLFITLFSHS